MPYRRFSIRRIDPVPDLINRKLKNEFEVFSIWKAFRGDTFDLGSFWRRNGQDYGPSPTSLKIMFSAAGDGVTDYT
ncbi:hypothetical protein Tco_0902903 [Tanacetum coccineum]